MIVYISVGNSDDKLTQARWAEFVTRVEGELISPADQIHGNWRSLPDVQWQNACWCIEFYESTPPSVIDDLKARLIRLGDMFEQDWISWAVVGEQIALGAPA